MGRKDTEGQWDCALWSQATGEDCCHWRSRVLGHNTQGLGADKHWIVLESVSWLATGREAQHLWPENSTQVKLGFLIVTQKEF